MKKIQVRSDDDIFLISAKCTNLKSRISVSNFKSRVSNSKFLMNSGFRSRLEILNRSPSRSRSLWSRLHHCYAAITAWKLRLPDVFERQELSLICYLLSKLVLSLILEKHHVVLEYFPVSLKILEYF